MIHIIQDIRPIATVEQPGFRGLIHALDPKYVLPKRSTVVQMMTKTFDSVVAKMQSELKQVYYCALTTDMWSSMNYDSFNGITVHYWHAETLTLKSRECWIAANLKQGILLKSWLKILQNICKNSILNSNWQELCLTMLKTLSELSKI